MAKGIETSFTTMKFFELLSKLTFDRKRIAASTIEISSFSSTLQEDALVAELKGRPSHFRHLSGVNRVLRWQMREEHPAGRQLRAG